jgi:hypothetical protein
MVVVLRSAGGFLGQAWGLDLGLGEVRVSCLIFIRDADPFAVTPFVAFGCGSPNSRMQDSRLRVWSMDRVP